MPSPQTGIVFKQNNTLRGNFWWPRAESNRRHADFQSAALPTELPGRGRVLDEGEVPSVKDRTASHLSPSPALASWSHARAGPRFAALSLSGAGAGSRETGAGAGSGEPAAGAGGRETGAAPRKRGLPAGPSVRLPRLHLPGPRLERGKQRRDQTVIEIGGDPRIARRRRSSPRACRP